ncbi:DUF805 domain-containing protein [Azospirillum sp. sgz301742]
MSITTLLFSFSGRASRKHFWLFMIAYLVILAVVMGVDSATMNMEDPGVPWLSIAVLVVSLWPALAIQVKRWHDRNKSGWWILIQLVPAIGPLWAIVETGFLAGTPTENRFGAPVA